MTTSAPAPRSPAAAIPWRHRLLTRTLLFLIVPTILPLLLASGAALYSVGVDARREAEDSLLASLADGRERVDFYFASLASDLRFVASRLTGDAAHAEENALLVIAFATTTHHDIEAVWLQPSIGPGAVLYSRREMVDRTGRSPLEMEALAPTHDVAWHGTHVDEFGEPVLTGSAPIRHPWEARPSGWLVFTIRPRLLRELPRGIETGRMGLAFLLDEAGRVVGRSDRLSAAEAASHPALRWLREESDAPRLAREGSNLVAWSRVGPVRWGLVVQQAEAEVYATRNRVAWLVVAACVALLLVTVPLAVTFSVRATRPITSLLRAMERFGAGEIALPGGLPEHGELGRLAAAFRQMTQDRLRTERRYHEIVTTTDDLITEVDGDGRLVFVNPVAERVFGLAPAGILGRSAFSFVHPDDRAKTEAWFAACIASRQQQATFENRQVAEDGGRISHFLWTCHISYDAQGRFSGMTGIAHDVTERRRAEEERRRLDERLAQSQKLESIGTLAGGVAHDFNNVLGAIVGYGSTLLSRMSPDDPLRLYAEQVLASAERGAGLTQGLLAFSRKQIINPRTIDLNASVRKVSDLLARLIGEDVALRIACAPQPLPIFADPTQVEQVLMNLATNARDAMPKGGALAITTEPVDGGAIPGAPEGARPHALLSVTDTGVGMDEETRARIFEPFFTTKEIGRGTGLGLAIVYGIVQQSHGSITVYSEPGKGTTFRIYLPLAAALPVGLGAEPPSAPARGGTETILLAEDDRAIRAIFRQVLSESGYRIIEAADGEAALRSFEERADEIELIVSDVVMPRKSGGELFRAAKARKPGVKVIFTSGYPADVVEEIGVLDEGVHFVPKPTTPQALLRKIREVLDGEAG